MDKKEFIYAGAILLMLIVALLMFIMGCGATPTTNTNPDTGTAIHAPVSGDVSDNDTTEIQTDVENKNVSNSTWLLLGQDIISYSFWLVISIVVIVGFWKGKWAHFGG